MNEASKRKIERLARSFMATLGVFAMGYGIFLAVLYLGWKFILLVAFACVWSLFDDQFKKMKRG